MTGKRILTIAINHSPELTGIGRYAGEFAAYLASEGNTVTSVTTHPYYPRWKVEPGWPAHRYMREWRDGAEVLRCPHYVPSNPTGFRRMLQDLSFLLAGWFAVNALLVTRRRYDAVFVFVPSYAAAFLGVWYRFWRRKSVLAMHLMDLQVDAAAELGMLRRPWLLRMLHAAERWVLRKADVVSTLSEGMRDRLMGKGVPFRRLLVFPNWVDYARLDSGISPKEVAERLSIPGGRRIALYSGAIGEKQGLEIVLDAAAALEAEWPNLLFLICGRGPYLSALRELSSERRLHNVLFADLQPPEVFGTLLRMAWLHLVVQRPTDAELYLPSKLQNILAVGGLAVVTADAGSSLCRLVEEEGIGVVVPAGDGAALSSAIRGLYAENERSAGLRSAAGAYAARHLAMKAVIDAYLRESGWEVAGGDSRPL